MKKIKDWIKNRFSASPRTTGWFVFFLSLALTMYLSFTEFQLRLSLEREEVIFKLNELENRFYAALNNGVSASKTLGFFAQNEENIIPQFDKIGKQILDSNPLIDLIQYLDSGTIVAVYPLAGNESVINFDVLSDPINGEGVREAIRRRDVFFSGPLNLRQGGIGIVGRYPLFENGQLKGFAAVKIDPAEIFVENELKEGAEQKFTVKLSKTHPNPGEIETYIPTDQSVQPSGFLASSQIDMGDWTLSVQLNKSTAFLEGLFAISLRIILSIALGLVAWNMARQPALLRKKVAEQSKELLQINERFELATRATSDVIWDWNIDRDKIYRSDLFFHSLGYSKLEDINSTEFFKTIIHPQDIEGVTQNLEETLQGKEQFWEKEFRIRKADGNYTYINDKGYILRDESGKAIRMIGATQDISKRKKIEIELMEANQSLANANEELKAFAFLASHDMREPLRMISSFMSLLDKKYKPELDEKAHQYIDFAIDGAKRLTNLINDLLEYSKVGFDVDNIEKIDTKALLREVLDLKSDLIRESNAQLILGDLPDIMGIKTPIQILFQNLIGNAIKYRNKDKELIIKVSGKVHEDFLEFCIEDNGIGIEAQYLDHIFGILKRLHPKEKYPGTGMGLATCRKIVTQHGGKIWAESEIGVGSKFLFKLKKYG
ncbi:ATP-binding protein [Algoriphagus litoralis]|uniref:ATP-binding protein n=1 Tax=Algoriphagus litoralis TaxID=2202829 RepID=UPI000DBA5C37|nr:ATP-binding protein [Algoriphagus litoralis]